MQLSPNFEMRTWVDGPGLFLHGRLIALVTPLPNGRARSERSVGTVHLRSEFHDDVDAGVRFLCAWVAKWHQRIEQTYDGLGSPRAPGTLPPSERPPSPPSQSRRRPRRSNE